jgi:hypothetical protein
LDSLSAAGLAAWTPVRVYAGAGEPVVEWALVGEPFGDPFFEQTADRAMRHPFNELFARRTSMTELEASFASDPGIAPSGFVFHMSRCGSTLIAQMLASLRASVVLSESQPIDALMRLRRRMTELGQEEKLAGWLRALVGALGRPHAGERNLFVKFHAWHVLELPFIARAFPDVPWAFVFREPRAVLRSQAKSVGAELVAGAIDPAYLGLDAATAHAMPPDEYSARVLAAFCEAALRNEPRGRARFVDYAALPEAVPAELCEFFAVPASDVDTARMGAVAGLDTKSDGAAFRLPPETESGAGEAVLERLASEWLDEPCAALRAGAASV